MKSLQTCFAGLVAFLLLAGCAQAIGQPTSTPQETIAIPTTTVVTEPMSTSTLTVTPIPLATHRPTPVESPSLTPAATIRPLASYTRGPTGTRTRTPTITPTNTLYVRPPIGGITWTPHVPSYACSALTISPKWGTVVKPRTDFIAEWKVYNTGANMWHVDDIVGGFVSGERMHNPDNGAIIISFTVYVGDKINIQKHMVPPKEPGTYTSIWGLRKTNKKEFFCLFDVMITVAK